MRNLREAVRQLRKTPGFTITAVITLALGIGATTAIFTLVNQVMLKSLPVTKPEELYRIGDKLRCCNWGGYTQGDDGDFALFSWEAYKMFRAGTPEFIDLTAVQAGNLGLGVRKTGSKETAATRNGEYVSGNFFRTLGIQPWIGRMLTDADDQFGAPPVAVMSYRVWHEKYGADPNIRGAIYDINGHPFTIVGVGPPGFYGAKLSGWGMPDFWIPVSQDRLLDGDIARTKRPNTNWLDLIGRVRPGVNPKALDAKLKIEFHDWLASHVQDMEPGEKKTWQTQTLHLVPGDAGVSDLRDNYQDGLRLLLIAAGCVLLVACSNLANLMLARGLKDRSQTSVRVALGASRARLVRKALIESVVLAIIGGVLGIAVAYAGTSLIIHLAFHGGPNNFVPISATPSWEVLLFTLGVSVLTGIGFGVTPAWMTSHVDPVEALRGANRSVGGGGSITQKSLVIAQAAMSLVLLSAAAMLGQSVRNLEHQKFGFETEGRYLAWINPTLSNYTADQMEPLFRRINERIQQMTGARIVAPVLYAPMSGDSWNEGVRIEGRPEPPPKSDTGAGWARVMPGFFDAIGAKIVQGRAIDERDNEHSRNVAVVNEAFVKRFFKNENPIGKHFGIDRIQYARSYEIVGVVHDIRYMTYQYRKPIYPMFWISEAQQVAYDDPVFKNGESFSRFLYNIVIWAPDNQPRIAERLRKALDSVDPSLVLYDVQPYSKVIENRFQQENMIATLTMLFGGLGLVLAAVGLYGVLSYNVEQRTSEIGLRMALGADRSGVIRMILRSAFLQVGVGLAIGVPSAIVAGNLMNKQLFEVKPYDPTMLASAILLLCCAALLASTIPASRAAGVEPMVALRNE